MNVARDHWRNRRAQFWREMDPNGIDASLTGDAPVPNTRLRQRFFCENNVRISGVLLGPSVQANEPSFSCVMWKNSN